MEAWPQGRVCWPRIALGGESYIIESSPPSGAHHHLQLQKKVLPCSQFSDSIFLWAGRLAQEDMVFRVLLGCSSIWLLSPCTCPERASPRRCLQESSFHRVPTACLAACCLVVSLTARLDPDWEPQCVDWPMEAGTVSDTRIPEI